jgi:hypothetical protein
VGAADLALLAVACVLTRAGVRLPLLGSQETLGEIVALEFLTVHEFPFLVVAATFWVGTRGVARAVVALVTLLMVLGYGVGAWVLGGGLAGLFWLLYLTVPNLLPFLHGRGRGEARLLVVSRWCVKVTLFMGTAGVVGGGDFAGPEVVTLGAVYFGLMTAIELLRVAEIPGDLAAAWKRLDVARSAAPGPSAEASGASGAGS